VEIVEVREILESLKESSDAENAIEVIKGLISSVRACNISQVINSLNNSLADFALENQRCPDCNMELMVNEWQEQRPYGDTYALETMNGLKCPDCFKTY
jgi:uncharacterized protein with PIN domain